MVKAGCKFCLRVHSRSAMCDPARRVLDALVEQGMQFNMPTVEFPEPVRDGMKLGGPGDTLMRQLVVAAALIDINGVYVPALVFTGRTDDGSPLPRWVMPGDDDAIDSAVKLVADVANMAKRAAAKARGES